MTSSRIDLHPSLLRPSCLNGRSTEHQIVPPHGFLIDDAQSEIDIPRDGFENSSRAFPIDRAVFPLRPSGREREVSGEGDGVLGQGRRERRIEHVFTCYPTRLLHRPTFTLFIHLPHRPGGFSEDDDAVDGGPSEHSGSITGWILPRYDGRTEHRRRITHLGVCGLTGIEGDVGRDMGFDVWFPCWDLFQLKTQR